MTATVRPEQLNFFERMKMELIGRRDGKIGLPKSNAEGAYLSPQVCKEEKAFQKFTEQAWLRLEQDSSEKRVEMSRLRAEVEEMQRRMESLDLDQRSPGEEELPLFIIRDRRMKQFAPLRDSLRRIHELKAELVQMENETRLLCAEAASHSGGRMAAYWRGCFKTNTMGDLPPVPTFSPAPTGELIYEKQHHDQERAETAAAPEQEVRHV